MICLCWLFSSLKKSNIYILLIIVQILSISLALVAGIDYPVKSVGDIFNVFFTFIVIYLFTLPFSKVNVDVLAIKENEYKLSKIVRCVNVIMFFFLLLTIYGSYQVLTKVQDIGQFRYDEGVKERFLTQIGLGWGSLLFNIFPYISVLLVTFHFYYIYKRKYDISFLCFINSLVLPLSGILSFTRTTFIEYILIYILNTMIFYRYFDFKEKQFLKKIGLIIIAIIGTYIVYVTVNRFEGRDEFNDLMTNTTISNNSVLASFVWYFSQWYRNGLQVLSEVNGPFNHMGLFSFRVFHLLLDKLGIIDYGPLGYGDLSVSLYQQVLPDKWFLFNGLPAVMYVEFGYVGTIIFALIYYFIAKHLIKVNKGLSVIFVVNVLFILPAMSIVGFYFKNYGFQYLVIWTLIFFWYMRK